MKSNLKPGTLGEWGRVGCGGLWQLFITTPPQTLASAAQPVRPPHTRIVPEVSHRKGNILRFLILGQSEGTSSDILYL